MTQGLTNRRAFRYGASSAVDAHVLATIGLNADLAGLKAGGRSLVVFLGAVVGLLVMQDALDIVLAWALGQERLLSLLGASVTLCGGHGTGAAWGKVFAERHGLASAAEIAIACATFGLILGEKLAVWKLPIAVDANKTR